MKQHRKCCSGWNNSYSKQVHSLSTKLPADFPFMWKSLSALKESNTVGCQPPGGQHRPLSGRFLLLPGISFWFNPIYVKIQIQDPRSCGLYHRSGVLLIIYTTAVDVAHIMHTSNDYGNMLHERIWTNCTAVCWVVLAGPLHPTSDENKNK